MWDRARAATSRGAAIRGGRVGTLVLVAAICAACVSHVRFWPDGDEWEPRDGGPIDSGAVTVMAIVPIALLGGIPHGKSALVKSGGAEVEIDLDAASGEFPLAGVMRNRGTDVLHVTFTPERETSGDAAVGQFAGAAGPVSFRTGEGFDLLPSGGNGPSERRFALRPDERWPESKLPRLGATVSYVVLVQGSTGEARIPLRFHVVTAFRNLFIAGEPQWSRIPCFMWSWYGRDPEAEPNPGDSR